MIGSLFLTNRGMLTSRLVEKFKRENKNFPQLDKHFWLPLGIIRCLYSEEFRIKSTSVCYVFAFPCYLQNLQYQVMPTPELFSNQTAMLSVLSIFQIMSSSGNACIRLIIKVSLLNIQYPCIQLITRLLYVAIAAYFQSW